MAQFENKQAKILKKEKWSTILGHPVHFMEGPYILCKVKSSGKRRMVENDEIQMLMKSFVILLCTVYLSFWASSS